MRYKIGCSRRNLEEYFGGSKFRLSKLPFVLYVVTYLRLLFFSWLKISLLSGIAAFSTRQLIQNRDELAANVERVKRAIVGFYNDHLKGPIDSMWDELFVRKEV